MLFNLLSIQTITKRLFASNVKCDIPAVGFVSHVNLEQQPLLELLMKHTIAIKTTVTARIRSHCSFEQTAAQQSHLMEV